MTVEMERVLADTTGEALKELQTRVKLGQEWAIKLAATLGVNRYPRQTMIPEVVVKTSEDLGPAALAIANMALAGAIPLDDAKSAMELLVGAAGWTRVADLETAIQELRDRQTRADEAKPRGAGPGAVIVGRF